MKTKFLVLVVVIAIICKVAADESDEDDKKSKKGGGKEHKWLCKGHEIKFDKAVATEMKDCWVKLAERGKSADSKDDDRRRRSIDDDSEKLFKKKKDDDDEDEDEDDHKKHKGKGKHFLPDGKFIACKLKALGVVEDDDPEIKEDVLEKVVDKAFPKDVRKGLKEGLKGCSELVKGKLKKDADFLKYGTCQFKEFKSRCKNDNADDA